MPFARIDNAVLHYEVSGPEAAPVILFSNSLGTDFRVWDGVSRLLEDRFRLVRYDKRGHGLSDRVPGPATIADHAAGAAGLLDRLGIAGAIVCGLSVAA